jgi:hypothetical protein
MGLNIFGILTKWSEKIGNIEYYDEPEDGMGAAYFQTDPHKWIINHQYIYIYVTMEIMENSSLINNQLWIIIHPI